jgi:hypothetical protein
MSEAVIGQCSICGGQVCVPTAFYGKPAGVCKGCGATEKQKLPIVPMERPLRIDPNKAASRFDGKMELTF